MREEDIIHNKGNNNKKNTMVKQLTTAISLKG
jgi:hypothetical protein